MSTSIVPQFFEDIQASKKYKINMKNAIIDLALLVRDNKNYSTYQPMNVSVLQQNNKQIDNQLFYISEIERINDFKENRKKIEQKLNLPLHFTLSHRINYGILHYQYLSLFSGLERDLPEFYSDRLRIADKIMDSYAIKHLLEILGNKTEIAYMNVFERKIKYSIKLKWQKYQYSKLSNLTFHIKVTETKAPNVKFQKFAEFKSKVFYLYN
jgi:hypothetical protein